MKIDQKPLRTLANTIIKRSPPNSAEENSKADLSITTTYFNHTGKEMTISMRNGMRFFLPRRQGNSGRQFVIRYETTFSFSCRAAMYDYYINNPDPRERYALEFKKAFMVEYEREQNWLVVKIDHVIDFEEIRKHGGNGYFEDFDIILSTRQDNIPAHPNFNTPVNQEGMDAAGNTFGLDLYIVDKNRKLGERFIVVAGLPRKIDVRNLPLVNDGLYIRFYGNKEGGDEKSRYDLDDVDRLVWVHKTKEEAANSSDKAIFGTEEARQVDTINKRNSAEFVERRGHYDVLKLEMEKEVQIHNRELALQADRLAQEQASSKAAIEQLDNQHKAENLRMKDYYEARSSTRKDSSELIKYIPAALAGVITAFIAFKAVL